MAVVVAAAVVVIQKTLQNIMWHPVAIARTVRATQLVTKRAQRNVKKRSQSAKTLK